MKDESENIDYGWIVLSLLMSIDTVDSRSDSHWEDTGGLDNRQACIREGRSNWSDEIRVNER
jgi:hypothetical protein